MMMALLAGSPNTEGHVIDPAISTYLGKGSLGLHSCRRIFSFVMQPSFDIVGMTIPDGSQSFFACPFSLYSLINPHSARSLKKSRVLYEVGFIE